MKHWSLTQSFYEKNPVQIEGGSIKYHDNAIFFLQSITMFAPYCQFSLS